MQTIGEKPHVNVKSRTSLNFYVYILPSIHRLYFIYTRKASWSLRPYARENDNRGKINHFSCKTQEIVLANYIFCVVALFDRRKPGRKLSGTTQLSVHNIQQNTPAESQLILTDYRNEEISRSKDNRNQFSKFYR